MRLKLALFVLLFCSGCGSTRDASSIAVMEVKQVVDQNSVSSVEVSGKFNQYLHLDFKWMNNLGYDACINSFDFPIKDNLPRRWFEILDTRTGVPLANLAPELVSVSLNTQANPLAIKNFLIVKNGEVITREMNLTEMVRFPTNTKTNTYSFQYDFRVYNCEDVLKLQSSQFRGWPAYEMLSVGEVFLKFRN